MPPDQHMFFLRKRSGESNVQRVLAWVRWKTIRRKTDGTRTAWARDERGDLTIAHMAADLGWAQTHAYRDWAKTERMGLVRRDQDGRLWLSGRIPTAKPPQPENTKKTCTGPLPEYLRLSYQQLSEIERAEFDRTYDAKEEFKKKVLADAVAAARAKFQQIDEDYYKHFGIELRRKEEQPKADTAVQIELLAVPDFFVQKGPVQDQPESVQIKAAGLYSEESGPVHVAPSLLIPEETEKAEFSPPTPSTPAASPTTPTQRTAASAPPSLPINRARQPELWPGFKYAADTAQMRYGLGEVDEIRDDFARLTIEERKAAIEGINIRVKMGEWEELRFIPGLAKYVRKKLWTAVLMPPARKKGPEKTEASLYLDQMLAEGNGHGD